MSGPDLSDYIEVPDRIKDFKTKFPDGSLQGAHKIVECGGKTFIEYVAYAYRTPDDLRPGRGTTWEPFPGTTPYTKNSEIENAETSAWGRALVAIGFVGKKVASATEVRNRSAEQEPSSRAADGGPKLSEKQKGLIKKLVAQKELTVAQIESIFADIGVDPPEVNEGWTDRLSGGRDGQGSELIDRLMNGPIPVHEPAEVPVSDVPGGAPVHEPQVPGSDIPWEAADAA
jgi:hypothetical protein